jgi:hypothetical protein
VRLTLPESKLDVKVTVVYQTRPTKKGIYRDCTIKVSSLDGNVLFAEGKASCSPKDIFTKLLARKLAMRRLLLSQQQKAEKPFSKADRQALFLKVCSLEKLSHLDQELKQQIDWRKQSQLG